MRDVFGYALAMNVLQSDLYRQLDDVAKGECDALISKGVAVMKRNIQNQNSSTRTQRILERRTSLHYKGSTS